MKGLVAPGVVAIFDSPGKCKRRNVPHPFELIFGLVAFGSAQVLIATEYTTVPGPRYRYSYFPPYPRFTDQVVTPVSALMHSRVEGYNGMTGGWLFNYGVRFQLQQKVLV